MSRIKTLCSVGAWVFCLTTVVAADQRALETQTPLYRLFAECTGRFSAAMEHAWLITSPDVEDLTESRAAFVELLDATTPDGRARETLHHRIETKLAHAALLTTASFDPTPDRANWAQREATRHLALCRAMLLPS